MVGYWKPCYWRWVEVRVKEGFLAEMFVADMLFKIHGLVQDTSDFHGIVANAEEKHMFATLERPAAD